MSRQRILERERRWARPAAICAILVAPLYVGSLFAEQTLAASADGLVTDQFAIIDANATELLGVTVARAIAMLLLVAPLVYLFMAAQARSERVAAPMIGFAFIGPILLAAQTVFAYAAQAQVGSDFVAEVGRGGDIYSLLDDIADGSSASEVARNLFFPALLGLLVAMVYVSLQAMRVGLLTRFSATFGMALAVGILIIPYPPFTLMLIAFWLLYVGLVFLGKAPRGRPPAWQTGEAMPWPKPGEERAPARPDSPEVVEGEGSELAGAEEAPKSHAARRERAKKRKRKQRRR
jgi:hypothetical protein